MNKNEIIQIQGMEYKEMTKQLLNECALATLIPSKVSLIGIKPNLVAPVPAEFGGTTHPEVVAGIIEYLQENGFTNLQIMEGSWVGDKTEESFEVCGYRMLSEQYGVPLIDAQKEKACRCSVVIWNFRFANVRKGGFYDQCPSHERPLPD